jgi:hypothetical protein
LTPLSRDSGLQRHIGKDSDAMAATLACTNSFAQEEKFLPNHPCPQAIGRLVCKIVQECDSTGHDAEFSIDSATGWDTTVTAHSHGLLIHNSAPFFL